MYELVRLTERTFYIDCPAKMGIYLLDDAGALLIDSGNDKEAGKKVLKLLDANGWKLTAILNTHSNADHIGGNRLLQDRLGVPAYTAGMEAAFTKYPVLEPSFLYGGYPCKALRNKFLMAQPSDAREIGEWKLPDGMEILPLPGHFFAMFGIKTPDGVWFLADCLSGENILEKYHLAFLYDVKAYLDTLDKVETLEGDCVVPAHAPVVTDIRPLCEANRRKVHENIDMLLAICREPLCFEEILKRVFDHYALTMDFNQYVLVGSTVRSYLSYLCDEQNLETQFTENRLLWRAVR